MEHAFKSIEIYPFIEAVKKAAGLITDPQFQSHLQSWAKGFKTAIADILHPHLQSWHNEILSLRAKGFPEHEIEKKMGWDTLEEILKKNNSLSFSSAGTIKG